MTQHVVLGVQQVCGDAEVWGDFIVPVAAAHLEGAINVDIDNCFHSPLGATLPLFGPWYGSEEMVQRWLHYVTDDWDTLQPGAYLETGRDTVQSNGSSPKLETTEQGHVGQQESAAVANVTSSQ